ncbi:MAG: hypothetical protein K2L07_05625 [Lachnospiraceae bacterium]|nr:hypothetical protein [Lachnospiraceae bacterium]
MFGYIVVNESELKMREMEEYRSYYCGLCRELKQCYGRKGQLSLSYDLTFLIILLAGLYEPEEIIERQRCMVHPFRKHAVRKNALFSYTADMTILLSWYKCRDDIADEKSFVRVCYGKSLDKAVCKIKKQYTRQAEAVEKYIRELSELEKMNSYDIDSLSGCFGHLLEEIFVMKEDEWQMGLRRMGFYMGKFIYILDSYDDLKHDREKKCFNAFMNKEKTLGFDDYVKQLLVMAAAEFAKEFEKLPVLKNAGILRNIIYSGVWTRYEQVRMERNKEREQMNEKSI